jgi:thioredoxin/glutathione reductase (selenoprotein)
MGVKYYNSYAKFVDPHTVELTNKKGEKELVTADKFVIAVGGRPSYPGIPGDKEFGVTSDDIFSQKKAPGKTLVVGASYVALECAGFMTAFGYDTTVMVRSIFLRGFDQDMANRIAKHMELGHTKFIRGATPTRLEKADSAGRVTAFWKGPDGLEVSDEFDTVLFAMGRYAVTEGINLPAAGLIAEKNGKFKVNDHEQTNVAHIYGIGDVQDGRPELTPCAIKAGHLLSNRLFANGTELMNYDNIPTTVFTPIEYGTVGLTEEDAQERYGADNIATYHTEFKPLEWAFNKTSHQGERTCYVKYLVIKKTDIVIGFHIMAPNAGEITQGVGIAFQCGMTKKMLDSCVGIHPTVAEDFVGL